MSSAHLRDNSWLLSRFCLVWSKFFEDVTEENPLFVRFGRYSRYRLGSIKLNRKTLKSYITITAMFKDQKIPVRVIDHTLAHELVHYIHGFSSKRVRLHKYPHAGGVVDKEMKKRGMGYLVESYKKWIRCYKRTFSTHE